MLLGTADLHPAVDAFHSQPVRGLACLDSRSIALKIDRGAVNDLYCFASPSTANSSAGGAVNGPWSILRSVGLESRISCSGGEHRGRRRGGIARACVNLH
jgi:hypothetical protein